MKQKFQNLGVFLNRDAQKSLVGGFIPTDEIADELGGRCLGCTTNQECKDVNKGKCEKTCDNGKKGCDGW